MPPRHRPSTASMVLGLSLALIQVFDLIVHLATDQIEPLRITANVAILLWLGGMAAGRFSARPRPLALAALAVYLGLNLLFLSREGLTNPAQNGAPRTLLFLLVSLTVALSGVLIYVREKYQRPPV